jgi:hypothetical protein
MISPGNVGEIMNTYLVQYFCLAAAFGAGVFITLALVYGSDCAVTDKLLLFLLSPVRVP